MREHYRIADFNVRMNCQTSGMLKLCEDYRIDAEELALVNGSWAEDNSHRVIDLCYTEEERKKIQFAEEPLRQFEYRYTWAVYLQKILAEDAFCFHASALSVDGEALLFSADSGTGKSTHAGLWKQYLSNNHEIIRLNDDKPVIRLFDEEVWVYGSPWAGKHSIHTNVKAPVKALIFLKQAKENSIRKVSKKEAFRLVFTQTFFQKSDPVQRIQMLELLDRFIRKTPIYELSCNISEEAVKLVYHTIWEEKEDED